MEQTDRLHRHLVDWLRDAHAMECTAESMLDSQGKRFDEYPEMRQRILQHREETRQQAHRLEKCLTRLGSDTSTSKDLMAKCTAQFSKLLGAASDEPVKYHLASYAFEQQEIVCYRSLIAAADHLGLTDIAAICRTSLAEEEAMADWLLSRTEEMTVTFLERERTHA